MQRVVGGLVDGHQAVDQRRLRRFFLLLLWLNGGAAVLVVPTVHTVPIGLHITLHRYFHYTLYAEGTAEPCTHVTARRSSGKGAHRAIGVAAACKGHKVVHVALAAVVVLLALGEHLLQREQRSAAMLEAACLDGGVAANAERAAHALVHCDCLSKRHKKQKAT